MEEREKERGGAPPPLVQFGLGRGRRAPPLGPSPLLRIGERRRILLGLGSPSRFPHTWRAPLGPATSSLPSLARPRASQPPPLLLYIWGLGAP